MGTRHRQAVINKEGKLKIQQYGQWDGYPDGQGLDILNYLKEGDLAQYQKNLDKIEQITEAQAEEIDKDENWKEKYPYLSRDCGAKIHKMIEEGEVKFVYHTEEEECQQWCEGFFTIDFKRNLFISEFGDKVVKFKLDKLPTKEEYISKFAMLI